MGLGGLVIVPYGTDLLVGGSDSSCDVGGGLAQLHVVLGWVARSRPGGLTGVPLSPPIYLRTPQWLHVVPEGGFKLDTIRFSDCGPVFPFCFGTHAC